uniref:C-type lectin domain-containing protein n=1 Tax=Hucho hucho TaxID=62062 RepID=A0A4W5K8A0_9TELE
MYQFPGGKKWAELLTCQTILLVLIGLLVSISTNQAATEPLSNVTQPGETPEEELASLRLKLSSVLRRYSRLCDDYASLAQNCSATVPVNDHRNHASRIEIEGDWRWVDNTKLTNEFWNQWSSEPDNNLSGGVEGEGPVVLESNTQTWSDVPCDFTYRRICQMDAIPITCP